MFDTILVEEKIYIYKESFTGIKNLGMYNKSNTGDDMDQLSYL